MEPLIAVTITNPGVYIIAVAIVFCLAAFAALAVNEKRSER